MSGLGNIGGALYGAGFLVASCSSLLAAYRTRKTHETVKDTARDVIQTRDLAIATVDQVTPSNGHTTAELVEGLAGAFVVHARDGHGGDAYPPKVRAALGMDPLKRTPPAKKQPGRRR